MPDINNSCPLIQSVGLKYGQDLNNEDAATALDTALFTEGKELAEYAGNYNNWDQQTLDKATLIQCFMDGWNEGRKNPTIQKITDQTTTQQSGAQDDTTRNLVIGISIATIAGGILGYLMGSSKSRSVSS